MGSVGNTGGDVPGPFNVKSVAIIGAGPSGLAAAKYLRAQSRASAASPAPFTRITIFEQQAQVGGVWYYSARPTETQHIPQTSPFCPPDPPLRPREGEDDGSKPPIFPSPMYQDLHTNIPHTLMQYSDMPFPEGKPIFPERETVQRYLEDYATDVRHLIRFSTSVIDVRPEAEEGESDRQVSSERWTVASRNLLTGASTTETYDAVVVASGHYSVPYVPDVPGVREFDAAHPGAVAHSKRYRTPDAYAGKKVLVVGNSASGLDIASQIGRVCAGPLLVSVRTPTPDRVRDHIPFEEVAEIERFLVAERGVRLRDGREIVGLDAVLFCTGYLFTYPFLDAAAALRGPPLVTDGRRVQGLYKHFVHIRHPTLAFPGLPIKVIPFPVAEAQAAVFARVWANAAALPGRADMEAWERGEAERRPAGRFHVFPAQGDGEYINELHAWATARAPRDGGKEPPWWDAEMFWARALYAEAKIKFEQTGKKAKSLAELGFRYESEPGKGEETGAIQEKLDMAG
ncbi:hypothetical protein JX266_001668 [Neoarthrinium moseri]|uniref:uncharacterized protein n=1 Tax=Neoarthrinium moseri TaxID=1658444 RepID=UPI001FDC6FA9|nr:uncharacterized protein JN550_006735 [Neoarthrinium moseri]KAI1853684.1 hypothetical protein JX266_001668 [Neoarthrinium moseri]KAI1867928.1 hypothetical protein JN550_006735 [Neoarthrinium moseri]